jgi:hypothetical protein
MITREAQGTIYTHAGPEIGVASTKAFTGQLTALYIFAMYLAQVRGVMSAEQARAAMLELTRIPGKLETILTHDEACDELAKRYQKVHDFLFLGRGIHYPIALEGALKLKEISYIHAEGYPAGEMKHGPNALIDENLPVVVIATRDVNNPGSVLRYEKNHFQSEGSKSALGRGDCSGDGGGRRNQRSGGSHPVRSGRTGRAVADSGNRSTAIAGLSHRGTAWLRRGSAAESGKIGDSGVRPRIPLTRRRCGGNRFL